MTTAEEYFEKGLEFWNNFNDKEAVKCFDNALKLDSKHLKSYEFRGYYYKDAQEYDKAIEDYTRAIELDPTNYKFYTYRGDCLEYSNRYEDALKDYNKAIRLNPNNAYNYYSRGFCYKDIGGHDEYELAIEDFNKAKELDSSYNDCDECIAECYCHLADSYLILSPHVALDYYNKALKLVSNEALYYYKRAKNNVRLNNIQDAINDYIDAIKLCSTEQSQIKTDCKRHLSELGVNSSDITADCEDENDNNRQHEEVKIDFSKLHTNPTQGRKLDL